MRMEDGLHDPQRKVGDSQIMELRLEGRTICCGSRAPLPSEGADALRRDDLCFIRRRLE